VTNGWYTISFGQSFGQAPRIVASLASYDGPDSAHLRRKFATTTGVQVKIEEDTTYDSETGHTSEVVHYLAVQGDGTLTGQAHETTTKYYHFGGQRVAMRQEGVVYYIAGDHPGTTSLVPRSVPSVGEGGTPTATWWPRAGIAKHPGPLRCAPGCLA
jgi:hypothetical protein